jgi:DNA modification methylase
MRRNSVDAVLTSPPYLNAIDYMRGHRMSLVWLGHSLTELRHIRSNSIGAERGSAYADTAGVLRSIKKAMGPIGDLPQRELLTFKHQ